jgi:hypothetical protein
MSQPLTQEQEREVQQLAKASAEAATEGERGQFTQLLAGQAVRSKTAPHVGYGPLPASAGGRAGAECVDGS